MSRGTGYCQSVFSLFVQRRMCSFDFHFHFKFRNFYLFFLCVVNREMYLRLTTVVDPKYSKQTHLRILFIVVLLCTDPSGDQVILDTVCQGEVVVPGGSHITIFYQGVMEMTVECLLNLGDIGHLGDTTNTDLLPFLNVWLRFGHCVSLAFQYLITIFYWKKQIEKIRRLCTLLT